MKNVVLFLLSNLLCFCISGQGLFCEGIIINHDSYDDLVVLSTTIDTSILDTTLFDLKYWWDIQVNDQFFANSGETMTFENLNQTYITCLYVQSYNNETKEVDMCYQCDTTYIYNYEKPSDFNYEVSYIDELTINKEHKFYSLSGKQFLSYESIPLGQSYIWNRKVYVKISYTYNP